jgi:hypothetical protein
VQANTSIQARILGEQLLEQWKNAVGATVLKPYERFVRLDSTGGVFNLTLPSVAECAGMEFILWLAVDGGDVTVKDSADSIGWADLVMNDVGDTLRMKSDGLIWHATKRGVA